MPIFELRDPNGEVYEINAPDEQTAIKAFKQSAGNVSQADLFNPDMQARATLQNDRPDLYGQGDRTWLQGVGDRARGVLAQAPLIGGFMDEARAGVRSGF